MNNEIKETVRRMNNLIEHQFDKEYHTECDLFKDIQCLLDYITNLQNIIKDNEDTIIDKKECIFALETSLTNLQEEIKSANESITWWTNRFNAIERDNTNLQEELQEQKRIEQASLDTINNLQEENEEIKLENEKLTQLWLNSQEKRRKAIKYLEQPYRDNFDYSKAQLLNILKGEDNK